MHRQPAFFSVSLVAWRIFLYAGLIFACVVLQASYLGLTSGLGFGFSNRDTPPAGKNPFGHRIDRTIENLKEGGMMYLPLAILAVMLETTNPWVQGAALTTMISRLLYVPIYLAGIPLLRTLVWTPGLFAIPAMGYGIWLGLGPSA